MGTFDELFNTLSEAGFFAYLLPFVVMFAISFALLQKVKIFGGNKKIDGILAIAMGFLFLQNTYLLELFQRLLPNVSFILLAVLLGLLIFGVFAGEHTQWSGVMLFLAFFFALASIITAAIYPNLGEGYASWFSFISDMDSGTKTTIFGILIIAIILWVIFKEPGTQGGGIRGISDSFQNDVRGGSAAPAKPK
ncbi:MAG: hypothetical protein Q7R96_02200 [Nanoarchaeota archaeon]|nr:hypothetical protein [Nanoarchaeota archaeon]